MSVNAAHMRSVKRAKKSVETRFTLRAYKRCTRARKAHTVKKAERIVKERLVSCMRALRAAYAVVLLFSNKHAY